MSFPYEIGRVLVGAPENTPLRIQHIAFEVIREMCADLGMSEGDEVTCLASTPRHLLIELAGNRRVLLERDFSSYIEVEPIETGRRPSMSVTMVG